MFGSVFNALLKRWDQLLLVGLLTAFLGLVFYLLTPQPTATIVLQRAPVVESALYVEPVSAVMIDEAEISAVSATPQTHRPKKYPKKPKAGPPPVLNINTATVQQLDLLPGVGPKLAQRILQYRKAHGNFSDPVQLLEVQGIGPKNFEKMKPYIRV